MIARRLMERGEMVESVMGRSGAGDLLGWLGNLWYFCEERRGGWMFFAGGFRFRFKLSLDQFLSFVNIFFFETLI